MLVLFRGHTTFTEVPDAPPTVPSLTRGIAASSTSQSADAGAGSLQLSAANLGNASSHTALRFFPTRPCFRNRALHRNPHPSRASSPTCKDRRPRCAAPSQPVPAVAVNRTRRRVARPARCRADFADDGWFVVPSAANEYGEAYAAADEDSRGTSPPGSLRSTFSSSDR